MNASEARRERREAERAERRREDRLAEKAEEQREEARAEERRQQAAREEAEARAAEERERERRAELRARLRRERTVETRRAQAQAERRRAARSDRAADKARREAEQERRVEAAERQVAERRAEAEEAGRSEQRLEQARETRRGHRQAADRQAEAEQERRRAATERRAAERRTEAEEAAHSAERLDQARETRREEQQAAERRAEAEQQLLTERRRGLLEERRRQDREAEAERERAAERRALEASRRAAERRAQEAEQERRRERRAEEGSARRAEREVEPEELPWLRTEDGHIVEWGGEPRLLRGVNVVGLDDAAGGESPLRETLALDDQNLEELAEHWGANFVRLPFSAGTILGTPPVLDEIDELVEALTGSGLHLLLALAAPEGPPDQGMHDVWALLGDRYQSQPAVLFEASATEAALALVRTIRAIHQSSLLFLPMAGGVLPVPNVVYTLRATSDSRPQLDERFAAFARRNAVLVSEWSNEGPDLGRSAIANAGLFERLEISWCAANWNAPPRLVADPARHRFAETRFGLIVRRALAGPVRPALTPF